MVQRKFVPRVAALGLGALMTGVLAACAPGSGAKPLGDAPYSQWAPSAANKAAFTKFSQDLKNKYAGKSLNIIGIKDPWYSAALKMIGTFEKVTGAKVTYNGYSYDDGFSKEVLLGQQKSSDADILMYDMPWIGKFAETGFVEPLDQRIQSADKNLLMYDDFYKVMADGARWKGQTLGMPFAPYFTLNVYNTDLLSKAGVKPPKTMSEFVSACSTIKKKTGVAGTAINNQSGMAVGQAYFEYIYNMGGKPFASEYPGNTGDYYSDMTPQFSSPQSKATIKMFKDLLDCEPKGALNIDWNSRYSAFATGQAAIIQPWNYDIASLADTTKSAVGDAYAVQPDPVAEGVTPNTPVGGWEMGINKYSKKKDLAWDFIQWFSSPAVNAAFLNEGGFAARYSVQDNPKLQKKYPWLKVQAEVVDKAFPAFRPQIPESFDVMSGLGDQIGAYLAGQKSLDEATAAADAKIGSMLKAAGYTVNN